MRADSPEGDRVAVRDPGDPRGSPPVAMEPLQTCPCGERCPPDPMVTPSHHPPQSCHTTTMFTISHLTCRILLIATTSAWQCPRWFVTSQGDKKHPRTDSSSCQIVLTCPALLLAAEGSFQHAGTFQRSCRATRPKKTLPAPSLCPQVLLLQSPSLGCCSRKPSQSLCPVCCKF